MFENYNLIPLDMYNGLTQIYCIKFEGRIPLVYKGLTNINQNNIYKPPL